MKITIDIDQLDSLSSITEGDIIAFDTPLLQKKKREQITVPISSVLGIPEHTIFNHLTKFVGERVQKGDILGRKKHIIFTKEYRSEVDGIIKEINHQMGSIIVDADLDTDETFESFFSGELLERDTTSITFKVKMGKEILAKEASGVFGGEIVIVDTAQIPTLTDEHVQNKILVTQKLASYEQVKLETLGVKAFITLYTLPEQSAVPWAQIAKIHDWEHFLDSELPFCTVDKKNATIYIYS